MGAKLTYLDEPDTDKQTQDGGSILTAGSRHGTCEMQGWRRNMEDAHLSIADFDENIGLYGVFDGHGGKGVSKFAAQRLPGLLKDTEAYKVGDYEKALENAFVKVDEILRQPEGRQAVRDYALKDQKKQPPLLVPRQLLRRIAKQPQEDMVERSGAEASTVKGEAAGLSEVNGTTQQEDEHVLEQGDPAPRAKTSEAKENGGNPLASTEVGTAAAFTESARERQDEKGKSEDVENDEGDSSWMQDESELEFEQIIIREGEEGEEEELELEEACGGEEELVEFDPRDMADLTPEGQGSTAVVILVVRSTDATGPRLICANAGDSRAVLSRQGAVVALSDDHKPENPEETDRITKAGGYVQADQAGNPRVQGDLNLSRAFGDLRYKTSPERPPQEQIVSVFPEVRTIPLVDEDEFIVIGCDGIWESFTNQSAIDFVRPRLKKTPDGALSAICSEICDFGLCPSMDRPDFDGHGCDNMTVTIVQLKERCIGEADKACVEAAVASEKRAREGTGDGGPTAKKSRDLETPPAEAPPIAAS